MKKRLLSITLCLCAVMQIFTPIGAAAQGCYIINDDTVVIMDQPKTGKDVSKILNDKGYTATDDIYEYIMEELAYLEMMGIVRTEVLEDIIIESQEELDIYYVLNYWGLINTIRVIEDEINTIVEVKQDDIVNILEINKNGQLSVDGYKTDVNLTKMFNMAMPTDVSGEANYFERCPYGSESDYIVYRGSGENRNIVLGNMLKNLAYTAFEVILSAVVKPEIVPAIVAGFFYNYLRKESPDADALSMKVFYYRHTNSDSNGFISNAMRTVFYCHYYLFDQIDFKGRPVSKNIYYCKYYF